MAQSLADAGLIPKSELPKHRLRHVLTQALGAEGGPLRTEVHQLKLLDGDNLLLCTDGLYEMVEFASLAGILNQMLAPQDTCQAMVDRAMANGGKDNITVLVAKYRIPPR